MPAIVDNYRVNSDKVGVDNRRKVTDAQREEIVKLYKAGGISQRALGIKYGVSKRSVQFILDPEKLVRNRMLRTPEKIKEYNRNHTVDMRVHRAHKAELLRKGLLTEI